MRIGTSAGGTSSGDERRGMNVAAEPEAERLGPPRWRGQTGRTEVWYATASSTDGTGYWIHHETVAPTDPKAGAFAHGWVAVFPVDATPRLARFGPQPIGASADAWFRCGDVTVSPGRLTGAGSTISWDLAFSDDGPPLYTFPKLAWERELLPGAQVVPWPQAHFTGTVNFDGVCHPVEATGALARVYGHGNPQRWCWLHAQLDGDSVIELVSAVARRPGLRRLPPLTMLRLRLAGETEWPGSALTGLWRLRTRIGAEGFSVSGGVGHRRLSLQVRLPPERRVRIGYEDPDRSTATCTNSERADLELTIADDAGQVRRWELAGFAHAEIGTRP